MDVKTDLVNHRGAFTVKKRTSYGKSLVDAIFPIFIASSETTIVLVSKLSNNQLL